MIQRLTISNGRSEAASLGIEPWADETTVPPGGRVDFEIALSTDGEPAEMEVGVNNDGGMTIWIVGASIRLITQRAVRRITDKEGDYAPQDEPIQDNATWRAIWGDRAVGS